GPVPPPHPPPRPAHPPTPPRALPLKPPPPTPLALPPRQGGATAVWSGHPNHTPPAGVPPGRGAARRYLPPPPPAEHCGELPEILGDVERWFAETRDATRPFCLYVHVMDAHYPYEPPPETRGRFDAHPCDLQVTGPVVQDYMTGKRVRANLT